MTGRLMSVAMIMLAAGVLLAACVAPPPEPTPKPTATAIPIPPPTAAPTPSVTPTQPPPTTAPIVDSGAAVVTHITVRPEHLELVNGTGLVVAELSYDAEADVFVDTLSEALGGTPGVVERPGGHEWFPTTRYTWPGAEVIDDHEPSGMSSDMNVSVRFTHPIVGNGISVSTVQGFRPGDDLQAFADAVGEPWHGSGYDEVPAETGPDIGERMYYAWHETYLSYANANAVSVNQWNGGDDPTVTSVIFAPWNFGIGHV